MQTWKSHSAGKYGKGFAVAAEEARSLAVRRGDAMKETTEIDNDATEKIVAPRAPDGADIEDTLIAASTAAPANDDFTMI